MMLPRTPSLRLDGRHAFVVGAGRGIGAALAAALAQAGATVTVAARSAAELDELVALLRADGAAAWACPLDVTDAAAVETAIDALPRLDIVVNSAGTNRPSAITALRDEDLDLMLALNLRAALQLSRAAARRLQRDGRGGSIVHVSSQMGHVGGPQRAVYCATKHGIEGMVKALAWELGPAGIRVNSLCPTFVYTAMTAPMFENRDFEAYVQERIALKRLATVEDLMGAAVFLASDASAMVTGSALMVDGGWTAA